MVNLRLRTETGLWGMNELLLDHGQFFTSFEGQL